MEILFTKIRENQSEVKVIISIMRCRWYTTLLLEIHHPINIQYFIPYFCVCEYFYSLFDVRYFLAYKSRLPTFVASGTCTDVYTS